MRKKIRQNLVIALANKYEKMIGRNIYPLIAIPSMIADDWWGKISNNEYAAILKELSVRGFAVL